MLVQNCPLITLTLLVFETLNQRLEFFISSRVRIPVIGDGHPADDVYGFTGFETDMSDTVRKASDIENPVDTEFGGTEFDFFHFL